MIVIADTSPIQYLHLIGRLATLRDMFGTVLVPRAVLDELSDSKAPEPLRALAKSPPSWFEVHDIAPLTDAPTDLGLGERAAIALALEMPGSTLLLDDGQARLFARSRGLRFTGTIGVVFDAERRGLLKASVVLAELRRTNMRLPPEFRGDPD
jgi:predicted nucleic acid-binding protein